MFEWFKKKLDKGADEPIPRPTENIKTTPPEGLPAFLVVPSDPLAGLMYGNDCVSVENRVCCYRIMVNPQYHEPQPEIFKLQGMEINECHVFSRQEIPSWIAISTMKDESVKQSPPLDSFFMEPYNLSKMLGGIADGVVHAPSYRKIESYKSIRLGRLGSWSKYDEWKHFDESVVFCHIFFLNGQMYKDYVLCARKDAYAWKLECYIEAMQGVPDILPTDFVPVGYLFGSFSLIA